uniref:Uncharacterized protein n=1 Tax=Knipowitschia caucasica TaxID=637954 RepID=A0AAV2KWE7_KNICA
MKTDEETAGVQFSDPCVVLNAAVTVAPHVVLCLHLQADVVFLVSTYAAGSGQLLVTDVDSSIAAHLTQTPRPSNYSAISHSSAALNAYPCLPARALLALGSDINGDKSSSAGSHTHESSRSRASNTREIKSEEKLSPGTVSDRWRGV